MLQKGGNVAKLKIAGGFVTVPAEEGAEGAEPRKITAGKRQGETVWEYRYKSVEGQIVGGKIHKHDEFGWIMDVTLANRDNLKEQYTLGVMFGKKVSTAFCKSIPNIDGTQPVTICAGWDKEKEGNFLYVQQGGRTVKQSFTRENPGTCPPAKKVVGMDDSDTKYDFTEQNKFLKGITEVFFQACESYYYDVLKTKNVKEDDSDDVAF